MKRVALSLVLVLLTTLGLTAQQGGAARPRLSCQGASCASGGSVVQLSITSPPPNHQTPTSPQAISGTASPGVVLVTVRNVTTGGPEIPADGTTVWNLAGGDGQPTTRLHDTFDALADDDLEAHAATPIGAAPITWEEWFDNGVGTNYIKIKGSTDLINPAFSVSATTLLYKATPATALTGRNYTVSIENATFGASSASEAGIIFGGQDTSNYCALMWRSSTQNPDMLLVKRVADVVTTLGSANVAPTSGHAWSVTVEDDGSLSATHQGIEVITATDAFCAVGGVVGIAYGGVRVGTASINSESRLDNFKLVDNDVEQAGIELQAGANVIEVEACTITATCTTRTTTITLGVADTQDPHPIITQPSTAPTGVTSTAAVSIAGSVTDNVGVAAVSVACPTCTPTSRTCTVTGTTDATFECPSMDQASGPNVFTVTALDAALNDDTDVYTSTYTPSDSTRPTIAFTVPTSGTTHTASASPTTFGGTAADNVDVTRVECSNSVGGGIVIAIGTTSWTCSMGLFPGDQVITACSFDEAANVSLPCDTMTVTLPTVTFTVTSPDALPGATIGVAYNYQLNSSGGTAPVTWTNDGAGTTLRDADAHCAGLVVSSAGVVSGTATTAGACTWTSRGTDALAATDTQTHTIVVSAAPTGGHDWFNTFRLRSDHLRSWSLRPQVGVTSSTDPYWEGQLGANNVGGLHESSCPPAISDVKAVYDYAGDSHPNRQDAAKLVIPAFSMSGHCVGPPGQAVYGDSWQMVGVAITTTPAPGTQETITLAKGGIKALFSNIGTGRTLLINGEAMRVVSAPGGSSGATRVVERGVFGTTPTTHAVGDIVRLSTNGFSNQLLARFGPTTPGNSYLIAFDSYFTGEWLTWSQTSNNGGQKSWSITSSSATTKIWEAKLTMNGNPPPATGPPFQTEETDVGWLNLRTYNSVNNGLPDQDTWAETNGDTMEPGWTSVSESIIPRAGNFVIKPNKWIRIWILMVQIADDWDEMTMWAADESNEAILVYGPIGVSANQGSAVDAFQGLYLSHGDSNGNHTRGAFAGCFVPGGQGCPLTVYQRNIITWTWVNGTMPNLTSEGFFTKPIP